MVSLHLDCLAADEHGKPVLVYDNHKRQRMGRRLPLDDSELVEATRAQQQWVTEVKPYSSGVLLYRGEVFWAETWACCRWGHFPYARPDLGRLPLTCWVATNQRIAGRLPTRRTVDLPWTGMTPCRVDVSRGKEWRALGRWSTNSIWHGTGVAPLAVAGVYQAYRVLALVDHPRLARL